MINNLSTRFRLRSLVLLVFLLAQLLPWFNVAAQSNASEHVAVILILDDSGSMKTSDPTNLRYTAAQLFISLLDEGDAVGALRFSTTSSPITNGIETITDAVQHTRLAEQMTPVAPDGFTDVKTAFEEARRMQQSFNQAGYHVVVVFLTDGKPEIPAPYPSYEQEALDAAQSLGIPVLSIALTGAGQSSFLTQVSNATGGRVIFASQAADLLDSYLQILGDLKDRTVISANAADGTGQALVSLDPALMPYVERVSFVASKPATMDVNLQTPDGKPVARGDAGVSFAIQNQLYSVYTLSQPVGGDWRFILSGSGAARMRAILYSRLRVRLSSPTGFFETGQPLPLVVRLIDEQPGQAPVTIIGQASFSALITRPDGAQDSLDQFYDDGSHGDVLAADGLYTRMYVNTSQAGTYQVNIQGFKGSVPVLYKTQIQGIAFPGMLLDQPAAQRYDIRANSVPIVIHLGGAEPNTLDHGDFFVLVTTPTGETQRIPLQHNGDSYLAEYRPVKDGVYKLRVEAQNAAYLDLPYTHTLETTFEARIIPTLSVQKTQVGLQPATRFALDQAQQGIPVIVTFSSTSPRAAAVTAQLQDLAGFTVLEGAQFQVAANSDTTLTLHIQTDPTLPPQLFQGRLVFSVPEGVDLVGGDIPIRLELFEPILSISPVVTSSVSPDSCLAWAPVRLVLHLNSTSTQNEQIKVQLDGLTGSALSQETLTVAPGESLMELTVLPGNGSFYPGEYNGKLVVSGVRPGLKMSTKTVIGLSFNVDPLWVTCRKPMIFSGVGLLFAIILFVGLITWARQKAKPPIVTGTLIHWSKDAPDLTEDVNLTAMNKTDVKIGKASQNDIVIPDENMQDEHVVILVERDANDELCFTLHPKASIRKGYREYTTDLPLEENVQYQMGNRMFKYIRDVTF